MNIIDKLRVALAASKLWDKITGREMLSDPKTTISGAVPLLAFIVSKAFKIEVPMEVWAGLSTAAVFFVGLFAKDKDTGK